MLIIFKSNIVIKLMKIYLFNKKYREVIDVTFDELHILNKMHFINWFTLYNYLIFIIWRDTIKDHKKRSIINIRHFNNIIESNNYSLSLQLNIIVIVLINFYILSIDAID